MGKKLSEMQSGAKVHLTASAGFPRYLSTAIFASSLIAILVNNAYYSEFY